MFAALFAAGGECRPPRRKHRNRVLSGDPVILSCVFFEILRGLGVLAVSLFSSSDFAMTLRENRNVPFFHLSYGSGAKRGTTP